MSKVPSAAGGTPLLIAVQLAPPSVLLNAPAGGVLAYSVLLFVGSTVSDHTVGFEGMGASLAHVFPPSRL
jgi:hypothetical protein